MQAAKVRNPHRLGHIGEIIHHSLDLFPAVAPQRRRHAPLMALSVSPLLTFHIPLDARRVLQRRITTFRILPPFFERIWETEKASYNEPAAESAQSGNRPTATADDLQGKGGICGVRYSG